MTNDPRDRLMTADELLEMPDDGKWQYELVRGKLIKMPPSSSRPSMVAMKLGIRAGAFIEEHGLGVCGGADWGVKIASNPDTVRAPDFAFVRAERVPPEGVPPGYWPGAPDLAVEVVSPSDRFTKVMEKVDEYLAAGTRLVWVLDPEARTTRVFAPGRPMLLLGEDGVLDGEDVLHGFTLPLATLWV